MNHPTQPSQPGHGMARDSERQDLLVPPFDTQSDRETEPDLFGTDNHETEPDLFGTDNHDLDSNPNTTRLLLEIRSDVKRMNKKFDSLDKKVKVLKLDNKQLKQQNENLSKQVTDLTTTVISLETRIQDTEKKNEQQEAQSRRENLKFHGIGEDVNETWDQSETKIGNYLSDELGIDDTNIKIERAHRLPSKSKPSPVIVKFSHFKDKDHVLKCTVKNVRNVRRLLTGCRLKMLKMATIML